MASAESARQTSALHQLQSHAQVELLDAIDELRLGGELNLPQLVVCGDQSSGKSSVLEAISGVRFPTNEELCTRFASELILRRAKKPKFSVKISPASHRSVEERQSLKEFSPESDCTDLQRFPDVVEEALQHISKLEHRSKFFEDKLIAEIDGPQMPPLTLVDLPGLIHASTDTQGENDIATVRRLVKSYMSQPNSIILAVVAANNNFANQVVLELLKSVPCGQERTLGIITKPDLAIEGSPAELQGIRHAQNEVLRLRLGWHALMNRGFKERDVSLEERDSNERHFFTTSNWSEVSSGNLGASTLRIKLSNVLLKSIQTNLPRIQLDVKNKIAGSEELARKLGEPNLTEGAERQQLTAVSTKLHGLIDAGTRGDYTKSFFYERSEQNMTPRRLRARLREYLEAFDDSMRIDGKWFWYSEDVGSATSGQLDFSLSNDAVEANDPTYFLPRQTLERNVEEHIRRNRGQEPEGIIPSIVYLSILSFQCAKWESIATAYAEGCWTIVNEFFREALSHAGPPHIAAAVLEKYADCHFEQAERKLVMRVKELVKPYTDRKFFTLNKRDLASKIGTAKQGLLDSPLNSSGVLDYAERDNYNNSQEWQVLNWVFAAYEVALNTFIDNFATFAIELCLVEDLYNLFTPLEVAGMNADEVRLLTAEPTSVVEDRQNNKERLQKLRSVLKVCNKHMDRLGDVQQPVRKGTTDDLAEQLQAFTISPPTPGPRSDTPSTARKSRGPILNSDPFMPTPPRTPRRVAPPSGQQTPARGVQRPSSAASNSAGKRREQVYTPEYVAHSARSPSPLQTSKHAPRSYVEGDIPSEEL